MVVEVPKRKLIEFIVHFEDLLGRAYGFVGLHPHEFPRGEGANLDSLRGLVVQMKSIAGGVKEIIIDSDEEAKVDDLELTMVHIDGIPFEEKDPDLVDEEKKEIEPEPKDELAPEPESVEVVSVEPVVVVKEEPKIDEEVEEEGSEVEVQKEAGEESRKKIEALEAQLAELKAKIGD